MAVLLVQRQMCHVIIHLINTYPLRPLNIDLEIVAYHQGLSSTDIRHTQSMLEDSWIRFVDSDILRQHHPIKKMVDTCTPHLTCL